jgi:2-C-methyl-D-erythritol 2,4-cyclodiphosphate synthase
MTEWRVGFGYDVHRLEAGRRLMLGGVLVSADIGCVAHSDGDVLLHALCDALLGAAGLGDIGMHFPDTDPAFAGISSLALLTHVVALLHGAGYATGNVDATVILERPKIASHVAAMRAAIAPILGVAQDAVSIKATTSEGLGFVGEGRGAAAHAVALVRRAGGGSRA